MFRLWTAPEPDSTGPDPVMWTKVEMDDGTYGWLMINVPTIAEMENGETDQVSQVLLPASARLYLRRS